MKKLVSSARNSEAVWIKMKMSKLMILILSVSLAYCTDRCPAKQTCHECIRTPNCAWCAQQDSLPWVYQDSRLSKRCFSPHNIHHPCHQEDVMNPSNTMTAVRNISLTSGTVNALVNVTGDNVTHSQPPKWISPQELDIQLRIDEPYSIFVTYLNAPVTRRNTSGNINRLENITMHSVELRDNSTRDINITYLSRCKGQQASWNFSNKCEGLQINDEVTFQIFLQAKGCSDNPNNWKKTISIYPTGIIESLIINLEVVCDCLCEREAKLLQNSTLSHQRSERCSGNGDLVCGVCQCSPTAFGERCECRTGQDSFYLAMGDTCQAPNSSIICSGRGQCICGSCSCHVLESQAMQYYGSFCECDDFSCDYADGLICSGPNHGICRCGLCMCNPQYRGVACEILQDSF